MPMVLASCSARWKRSKKPPCEAASSPRRPARADARVMFFRCWMKLAHTLVTRWRRFRAGPRKSELWASLRSLFLLFGDWTRRPQGGAEREHGAQRRGPRPPTRGLGKAQPPPRSGGAARNALLYEPCRRRKSVLRMVESRSTSQRICRTAPSSTWCPPRHLKASKWTTSTTRNARSCIRPSGKASMMRRLAAQFLLNSGLLNYARGCEAPRF